MRIAGEEAQPGPAATGAAADPATEALAARRLAARQGRRRRAWITIGVSAAVLLAFTVYAVSMVQTEHNDGALAAIRPSGIPRNIPTGLANMMEISSIPGIRAPGFTLTDQHGRAVSLTSLRGKVVVLGFMDSRCSYLCPVMSREFTGAYRDLGVRASKVVFVAVNVNQRFASVRDVALCSAEHHLSAIPSWHFLTGTEQVLQPVWRGYYIMIDAPNSVTGIVHTATLYFIDARGAERFLAAPMVTYNTTGHVYLPPAQVAAWAGGIARLAGDLAR